MAEVTEEEIKKTVPANKKKVLMALPSTSVADAQAQPLRDLLANGILKAIYSVSYAPCPPSDHTGTAGTRRVYCAACAGI